MPILSYQWCSHWLIAYSLTSNWRIFQLHADVAIFPKTAVRSPLCPALTDSWEVERRIFLSRYMWWDKEPRIFFEYQWPFVITSFRRRNTGRPCYFEHRAEQHGCFLEFYQSFKELYWDSQSMSVIFSSYH